MANKESEDIKGYFYERTDNPNEIQLSTVMYRYIDLDRLFPILEGNFYFPRKGMFYDAYDAGTKVHLNAMGRIRPIEPHRTEYPHDKIDDDNEKLQKNIARSTEFLASCWSALGDSYLLWKAYTSGNMGVCIETRVEDFIYSFENFGERIPLLGKMHYQSYEYHMAFIEYLFRKIRAFENENEYRIYLILDGFEEINMDEPVLNEGEDGSKGCEFKINPEKMINRIILSPFMRDGAAYRIKQMLTDKYPFLKNKLVESSLYRAIK